MHLNDLSCVGRVLLGHRRGHYNGADSGRSLRRQKRALECESELAGESNHGETVKYGHIKSSLSAHSLSPGEDPDLFVIANGGGLQPQPVVLPGKSLMAASLHSRAACLDRRKN